MPRFKMTHMVPRWVRESVYVIGDDEEQAEEAFCQGHIDEYGDSEITDRIEHLDCRGMTVKKLSDRLTPAKALREIIRVRNHWAEHNEYPEGTVEYPDGFDEWVVNLCETAHIELEFCNRCDTDLDRDGYCKDLSCPHSDYLQHETWTEG